MWRRAEMCERGRIFNAGFAVFCAGFRRGERGCASGDVRAEMCEWGRIFNAGFAVFCAVFRRGERGCGERGWASGDVLAGTVLTRCLQCSTQGFAGASGCVVNGDLLAGMWRAEVCERGRFFLKLLD
jgi:hypothetical protein